MNSIDATSIAKSIEQLVQKLLAKPYGRLIIEKHENVVQVEETDKSRLVLK